MRITGGSARGRALKVPKQGDVRPTTDKMRQVLYNMLAHSKWALEAGFELEGAYVMDIFCGSGALGGEALSRGAAHALFVDQNRSVLKITKDNIQSLGFADQAQFFGASAVRLPAKGADMALRNLVLLDPPYRKDLIAPTLQSLVDGGWLATHALIIAESEKGWAGQVPICYRPEHSRADGDCQLNIWSYAS